MFPILQRRQLAPDVSSLRLRAPLVARHCRPGQFVILRVDDTGERIPLTIADADARSGTIDVIVKAVGRTTEMLCAKRPGESIADVAGPLGRPTDVRYAGHIVAVGGGVGTAVIYPLVRALRAVGNRVTALIGGRTRSLVVLEGELRRVADAVCPCTDDGTYGFHGTVADRLAELLRDRAATVDAVYAAGPVPMMKAVVELTRPLAVRTVVSLNPIMVDGTGMCGGCRVTVDGEARFACVDGPEFDGHAVDFDELADRLTTYRAQEAESLARLHATCHASPRRRKTIPR